MATSDTDPLLFGTTQIHVDATFWHEVEQRKLNIWKLNSPTIDLPCTLRSPLFSVAGYRDADDLVSNVTIDNHSFRGCHNEDNTVVGPRVNHSFNPADASSDAANVRNCNVRVDFYNCNTIEEFNNLDRKHQTHFVENDLVNLVKEDKIGKIPLTRGYVYSFADLKYHKFAFATAMPVADLPQAGELNVGRPNIVARKSIHAYCSGKNLTEAWWKNIIAHAGSLAESHDAWGGGGGGEADHKEVRLRIVPFLVPLTSGDAKPKPLTNASLAEVNSGAYGIAMVDAGSSNANYPGWMWRNVVTAIRIAHPQLANFTLIAIRSAGFDGTSVVFECKTDAITTTPMDKLFKEMTNAGWHKGSHKIDLSAQMDPVKLADSSANLNLTLMKWRMLPTLNLDRLQRAKVLLLGSGTLGCNIARHLVMWGVRHITMLDRGNVSYSNPVRQTLFEMNDVLKDGEDRVKSIAACKALKRILPTVEAHGVNLEIRMPGHRVDDVNRDQAASDVEKLIELIKSHDVVYLLTDSRESRWLPTLLCVAHNIPCINAALAFDSYLVMRHGLQGQGPQQVGCYFCNDVVAPIDSLSARSLDQQCTVTRPGVSAMASALAVELLASLLNHPRKFLCPAWIDEESPAFDKDIDSPEHECSTVLGIIPHQLRGNINQSYACNVLHGRAYTKCTACSAAVVDAYKKGGVDWILKVINDPAILETVSGLEADKKELEDLGQDADCDFDDE